MLDSIFLLLVNIGLYAPFSVVMLTALGGSIAVWSVWQIVRVIYPRPRVALLYPIVSFIAAAGISWQGDWRDSFVVGYGAYRACTLILFFLFYAAVTTRYDNATICRALGTTALWFYTEAMVLFVWFRAVGVQSPLWNIVGGQSTYLAASFVVLLPFGAYLRGWQRVVCYACGAVLCAMLALQSRALVMSLAVMGLMWIARRFTLKRRVLWGGAAGSGLLLTGLAMSRMATTMVRLDLWRAAVEMFLQNPLRGVGVGQFAAFSRWDLSGVAIFAHSTPLTIAAEMGLVGLAPFSWLIWMLWRTRGSRPAAANIALVGYAAFSLWNEPIWWWNTTFLVAAIIATTRQHNNIIWR